MFFSGITENLNWVILITNFLTFKRWDGHGGSLKGPIFRGGGRGHEKSINKGNCPKRGGGLDSADVWGGPLQERGGLIPQCIPWFCS